MSRRLAHPVLVLLLALTWLLLQPASTPAAVLVGLACAWLISRLWHRLHPPPPRLRRLRRAPRLFRHVLVDVVRSNIAVAHIVLGRRREVTSGFVHIPLELTNPWALALLATIITATPGTIWVSHNSRRGMLVIHVLDLVDKAAWIHHIKTRYETPLLEMFP